jgi:hypothetical protein
LKHLVDGNATRHKANSRIRLEDLMLRYSTMHFVIYALSRHETHWRVLRDAHFIAAFSDYETAKAFVLQAVETRCRAGQASKVLFEDEDATIAYRCRCLPDGHSASPSSPKLH